MPWARLDGHLDGKVSHAVKAACRLAYRMAYGRKEESVQAEVAAAGAVVMMICDGDFTP